MEKIIEKIIDDIACNCAYKCESCDKCLKDITKESKSMTEHQLNSYYQCRFENIKC